MPRTRAGDEPVFPPALGEAWVFPLPDALVDGEPSVPHVVPMDRAMELVGMPYPAFTTEPPEGWAPPEPTDPAIDLSVATPPDEVAVPDPGDDAGTKEV